MKGKGRHEGTGLIFVDSLSPDVDSRIEKLIKRLKIIRPTLSCYKLSLWNEVGWMKRDRGLRRFFVALIFGPRIIVEKIRNKKDPRIIGEIEWSIEQLEEHVPPTKAHYNIFLKNVFNRIRAEEDFRKAMSVPLPG